MMYKHISGIDLGVLKSTTAIAFIEKDSLKVVYEDELKLPLIDFLIANNLQLVAIDAPLSLPSGRKSLKAKNSNHFRECDIKLQNDKIKFFPVTLGAMRKLTERGILLKNSLVQKGVIVIETFPGASYDLLKINRKNNLAKLLHLKMVLKNLKINYDLSILDSDHKIDAVYCLLSGIAFKLGKAMMYEGLDGKIVVYKGL
ncbi:MAG: DUF429 domain-containing protein [Candidatus Anstonellales archaeon]